MTDLITYSTANPERALMSAVDDVDGRLYDPVTGEQSVFARPMFQVLEDDRESGHAWRYIADATIDEREWLDFGLLRDTTGRALDGHGGYTDYELTW